ncbi:MAG: DUF2029 domain-containing protein [Hyphomicrobiaceae bacterium]|nr:DUF2029 domain-containing protein [Hyphomicrobiaceae bacterium]
MIALTRFFGERPLLVLALIGGALVAAAAAGPTLHRNVGGVAWLALLFTWAGCAAWAARSAGRAPPFAALAVILTAAVLMRVPLLLEPPYLSSDMYRYVWDGRVQGAGINPYVHVPAAPELAHLRDRAIYENINRADYAPTIYPPAAQLLFWLVTRIGDGAITMKLALLGFEGLAIAGLVMLLREIGRPATAVVAYAWHPLPVWEIAGNGHIDAVLIGLMVASLCIFVRGRTLTAGAVASVAALVKPTSLLLMPVLWRPWDWKLPTVLACTIVALYAVYISAGTKVLGFLPGYVAEEELSTGGGFRYFAMLQSLTGPIPGGSALYVAFAAVIMCCIAVRVAFRAERTNETAIDGLSYLLIAFLVLLTPHYPWYYLALAPVLVLRNWTTPWVLMTGGFLLYNVIPGDRLPSFQLREAILHLGALIALASDVIAHRQRDTSTGVIRT